ncbi:unnamed protein product [Porites evermanni]|uniref:Uncharacterized protein n=1 Tax=Porites evermanni TaxID=104178 RepID=A0ABN8SSK6_9CNID|nr:unnamed protein product [Porites evermanni]
MNWVVSSLAIACLCLFLVVQTNGHRCSEYEKMFGCKDSRTIPVKSYECTEYEKLFGCKDSKRENLKRHLRVSERIPEAHRSPVPLPDEGWNLKMESGFKHRKRALLNYKYQDQKQEH